MLITEVNYNLKVEITKKVSQMQINITLRCEGF